MSSYKDGWAVVIRGVNGRPLDHPLAVRIARGALRELVRCGHPISKYVVTEAA